MVGAVIRTLTLTAVWGCAGVVAVAPARAQDVSPPQFRTGVTAITVPVRVLDAQGKPITGLTAEDFEIRENGVRQNLTQFTTHEYRSDVSAGRMFIFLLGFGNHEPGGGVPALLDLVQSGLLPGDRVGVVAYLRVIEPSLNHRAVARFLERYRKTYLSTEGKLQRDGKRPMLPLSQDTLQSIDSVFGDDGLRVQSLPGGAGGKANEFRDWNLLVRTLDFVRTLKGEKHVVWLLQQRTGLGKGGAERLARAASAAQTTVSIITTGGSEPVQAMTRGRVQLGSRGQWETSMDMQRTVDDKELARLTGGTASFYRHVRQELQRVATITEFEYLLGYQPDVPPAEGEFREIEIRVHRAGAQPLFRHGVEPRPSRDAVVDLRPLFSEGRLLQAAESDFRFIGIPVKAAIDSRSPTGVLEVSLEIDPSRVLFLNQDGRFRSILEVLVYVADANGAPLARKADRIEIAGNAQDLDPVRKRRIQWTTTIPVTGTPAQLKAVVYDYDSDRLGSTSLAIR